MVRDGNGREGIEVVASDDGPGIADLERALQDGYTTGGGLGLGLPGARRLVDEFDIQSAARPGHDRHARHVAARRRAGRACLSGPPWPAALERGEAGAPLAGETRSGDLAVFAPFDGGALVAVIDGLGHGPAAADAAEAAATHSSATAPPTRRTRCSRAATRPCARPAAWSRRSPGLTCPPAG